jgi:hypothetical protein
MYFHFFFLKTDTTVDIFFYLLVHFPCFLIKIVKNVASPEKRPAAKKTDAAPKSAGKTADKKSGSETKKNGKVAKQEQAWVRDKINCAAIKAEVKYNISRYLMHSNENIRFGALNR